jgi:transcriptional regulator with XRE-family HTH domain
MGTKRNSAQAGEILRRRYVGDDVLRRASVEEERVNAQIAEMIHEYRTEAGLNQKELAELVGTTQSVISRLEDAEYEGHSLTMLDRIARAIKRRVAVSMPPQDPEIETMRFVFRELIRKLRRQKGLTVDQLAQKLDVDRSEVIALERGTSYKPKPLLLHRVSKFFDLPEGRLAVLVGAVRDVPVEVREQASRFAAKSDSFKKLTDEEKQVLDEFVKALKAEA